MEILAKIQKQLKAPKGQFNQFGGYYYRSCEDILEAVKPLLGEATLTITDEIIQIGDRYYIKAIVTLTEGDKQISVSAFARESLDKKGMDVSQITGAASSYARKYALNGLFLIDDTKDADSTNTEEKVAKTAKKAHSLPKEPTITDNGSGGRVKTDEEMETEEKIRKMDLVCSVCGVVITGAEKHYSLEKYGAKLCRTCQENSSPLKKSKGQDENA